MPAEVRGYGNTLHVGSFALDALILSKSEAGARRVLRLADALDFLLFRLKLPMNVLSARLKQLQAQITSKAFIARELACGYVMPGSAMRILISDRDGWTPTINKKFRFTRHQATFGDISKTTLEDFDLIVPLTIDDLRFLDGARDRIANNPIPIPSMQSVLLCDDKQQFNQWLTGNGFGEYIPRMGTAASFAYPYILKKGTDEAGKHSHIIVDREQEEALSDQLADPDYFAQDFVFGSIEYATHVLFKNGRIVCSLNVEYGFGSDTPIKGRDTPIYTMVGRCPYLHEFSEILSVIAFEGLCCFNYKVRDGRPMVLEVNPRFGRSLCGYFFAYLRHLN